LQASRALTADYEHKERAFLREQAGILAASLQEGRPCPVCGSTNHAQPAVPGSEAPSESELRLAKRQASAARDYAYNLSREASDWNGRVQTKQAGQEWQDSSQRVKSLQEQIKNKQVWQNELKTTAEALSDLTAAIVDWKKKLKRE